VTDYDPARVVALIDAVIGLIRHAELLADYAEWGGDATHSEIGEARDALYAVDPTGRITIEARRAALESP